MVNPLQMLLGLGRFRSKRNWVNIIALLFGLLESAGGIGLQRAALGDAFLQRRQDFFLETRSQLFKANEPGIILSGAFLDAHQKLGMPILPYFPSVFETLAADFNLVYLDLPFQLVEPFPLDHRVPYLMPHQPDRPIRLDPQMLLEVAHRDPLGRRRHQKDCPEPLPQRNSALMKNCSSGGRGLPSALITFKKLSAGFEMYLGLGMFRTPAPLRPAHSNHIFPTGLFIGESILESKQAQLLIWLHAPILALRAQDAQSHK